jgi:hypothetical protein
MGPRVKPEDDSRRVCGAGGPNKTPAGLQDRAGVFLVPKEEQIGRWRTRVILQPVVRAASTRVGAFYIERLSKPKNVRGINGTPCGNEIACLGRS